jgi:hypothetical protein
LLCSIPSKSYFDSAAFSPDGQSVLCLESSKAFLYHLVAEKVTCSFNPPDQTAHFVCFTPDGKKAAIIGSATNGPRDARQDAIFLYNIPPRVLNPPAANVDDAQLEKLWDELSSDNELRLQRVLSAFRIAPKLSVDVLRKRLPAVTREEQAKVERWMTDLDAAAPATRESATQELLRAAHRFAPLLEERKKAAGPGEVHNRLTFVLNRMVREAPPAALIRELRAVALLERMATAEARKLLDELAKGASGARLTAEARSAQARMSKGGGLPR